MSVSTNLLSKLDEHYYEAKLVNHVTWESAYAATSLLSYRGLQGYLATITSETENNLIANLYPQGSLWIGASDKDQEGKWFWMAGPEKGTQFWEGTSSGKAVNNSYSNWYGLFFDNMGDATTGADYGIIYGSEWLKVVPGHPSDITAKWGDSSYYPDDTTNVGYAVEYGGLPATYTITPSSTSINEGDSVTFNIITKNVEWGSKLTYRLTGPGISSTDFESTPLEGTLTVIQKDPSDQLSGVANLTLKIVSDNLTEGWVGGGVINNESLTLSVFSSDTANAIGSKTVNIIDTSKSPVLGPQQFSGNGHFYEYVFNLVDWTAALDLAGKSSYRGLSGYLVTVTSSAEQSFVSDLVSKQLGTLQPKRAWMGASNDQVVGKWKWKSGPEEGTLFWNNGPIVGTFARFTGGSGEPNNYQNKEYYAAFEGTQWLDLNEPTPYMIEYGGLPATYTITPSSTSINEGDSVTFTIDTKNVEWGTTISYTLTGINQSDLASGSLTGTATVNQNGVDGRATVTVNLASDQTTEGNETLAISVSGQQSSVTIQDTSRFFVICFTRGTHIQIGEQSKPVESLNISNQVSTTNASAAVKWIGYQRRTPEFAQFQDYLPVRIAAGALDDNLPFRDLYLSPDHAVLVDGHLIHAKALVNGKSIVQTTQWTGDIEYYHIETEAHEIIFAEGVPCETFIDNVSREQFDNYAEYQALYPNTRMMKELPLPRVKFKRQLPQAIKQRLESRISELDRQHSFI